MLSSSAAALKLRCSATARNVRSWWSVRVLSSASVSAIPNSGSTIGQVTEDGGRARIAALVEAGSFFELDRMESSAAVVGVGTIGGRDVALYAMDATSLDEMAAAKVVKVQELALRSRIPLVCLH